MKCIKTLAWLLIMAILLLGLVACHPALRSDDTKTEVPSRQEQDASTKQPSTSRSGGGIACFGGFSSFEQLLEHADLVVLGTVSEISPAVTVSVDRVYMGEVGEEIVLTGVPVGKGATYLLFLKRSTNAEADNVYSSVGGTQGRMWYNTDGQYVASYDRSVGGENFEAWLNANGLTTFHDAIK